MRAMRDLIKDRHGTWYAQRKVPERLQVAVARVLNSGKAKQVYLKRSLGTKVLKDANVRAKSVLAGFDRTLHEASERIQLQPQKTTRSSLNASEIKRMCEALYRKLLADDEAWRFGGRAHIEKTAAWMHENENPNFELPYPLTDLREFGWQPEQLSRQKVNLSEELASMQEALALGDILAVEDDVALLLANFEIPLDKSSPSYRELGAEALRTYVRALKDIEKRNAGEPVETPKAARGPSVSLGGGTLRDALDGWEKERTRPAGTVHEYKRAVEMFIQLHGNLPVVELRKSHARQFREALQLVPRIRKGDLQHASLPELSAWGAEHPQAPKVSSGTVNKQLGAVQAIATWGHHNGVVPEDVPWSDPFHKMRVDEDQSERAPFEIAELQLVFDSPLFRQSELPAGAKGDAGFWLPLLALFTGARQAELAGLRASNVQVAANSSLQYIFIVPEAKAGKTLKTRGSERAVPVHPQLVKLGFLKFVEIRRKEGEKAWLFPEVAPDRKGALPSWSKWFGRYLRTIGVNDTAKVFHSFRHGFKDAARAAKISQEVHDALTGHSNTSTVSAGYGAKNMIQRFGAKVLSDAVKKISYPGLDLSKVRTSTQRP